MKKNSKIFDFTMMFAVREVFLCAFQNYVAKKRSNSTLSYYNPICFSIRNFKTGELEEVVQFHSL